MKAGKFRVNLCILSLPSSLLCSSLSPSLRLCQQSVHRHQPSHHSHPPVRLTQRRACHQMHGLPSQPPPRPPQPARSSINQISLLSALSARLGIGHMTVILPPPVRSLRLSLVVSIKSHQHLAAPFLKQFGNTFLLLAK